MNMPYRLARLISFIFHPVLMPTYALLLLFSLSTYFRFITTPIIKQALFGLVVFNTLLMPVIITWILYRRGFIKSFYMEQKEERILPFVTNALLMLITYFMIIKLGLPRLFAVLLLGAAAAVILTTFITFKWKVSIHMVGIGALVGMFFALSALMLVDLRIPIIISLLVAGLIGVARLSMQSHQQAQIYAGFFIGFLCEYFILRY